jgi:hypothetical protein
MSYYIGATGEYIWEELLDNATSNVVISNNINFDANPLTDAIQQTITDALGTAVGELIAPITEVPSATGVGVVALTALGLLSYYKLNRTSVQDVDSMVYSADYASTLTPGMFDDRVRIRYDSNHFSNVFYYDGGVKKGEILTSRLNLLPVDSNNVDIYTSTGKIGIGTATPATSLHVYHATDNILRLQTATNGKVSIEFARGTNTDTYADYRFISELGTFKFQYEDDTVGYGDTGTNLINILPSKINLYKDTEVFANVGIGTNPAKPLHIYNATSAMIKLHTASGGVPSIEFVRGADDDNLTDYIMGNYTGIFKISGRNLTTTTDRIVIGETGNVGIGTNSSGYRLEVSQGTTGSTGATCFPLKISAGAYTDGGNNTATLIGLGTQYGTYSKCAIGHSRTGSWDRGSIVFLCNNTINSTNVSMTDERMRITSGGNVGIANTTPLGSLHIGNGTIANSDGHIILAKRDGGGGTRMFRIGFNTNFEICLGDTGQNNTLGTWVQSFKIAYQAPVNSLVVSSGGSVGVGTAPLTPLHTYHATANILRLETGTSGTTSIQFTKGTTTDALIDYRLISDTNVFKLQYSNDTLAYGGTGSDLINISTTNIKLFKNTEITGNVGVGTTADATYKLDVNGSSRFTGNVGIGTTPDATYKLDVNGTSRFTGNVGVGTTPHATYGLDTLGTSRFTGNVGVGTTPHETYKLDTLGTSRYTGNVGINTTPHATYGLDVLGDIRATAFRGDGANITALNEANLVLTTQKIYERFNTTNFAIIDDKIDLPPNYSFNITDYDSQTLFNPSAERKYKGKMTANYDDRNGVYKLITTNNRTDNKAVLNYKVGDKISIRNTADPVNDYLLEGGFKYFNSLLLIKQPSNIPLNWASPYPTAVLMYEWLSSDGLEGRQEARVRTPTDRYFPFTTVITFIIEAGFTYYLAKLYNEVDYDGGGSIVIVASPYGDDTNDFNRAFGAGQTFKLQITGTTFDDDYLPKDYMSADIGIASAQKLGGVKKGRGVAIDPTTGVIDAVPVSSDLINSMNTSHFTNNVGTGKIDISSSYVAPNATKLATSRNIASVGFDGSGNIDIPYFNLTNKITVGSGLSISAGSTVASPEITVNLTASQIPDLGAGKITSGTFSADRIPNLDAGKINSGTFIADRIPDLGAGKITSGTFTTDRIPDLAISKITTLQTTLDGKAPTSHNHAIADITNLQTTLDGKAPTSHNHAIADITNLQTTLDGKAPTSHTHTIANITNLQTTLDGKAPTSHNHAIADITNLQTTLDGKQATLSAGVGIDITGNIISAPAAITTWLKNTTKVYYNDGNVGIGTTDPQTTLDIRGTSPTIKLLDTRTDGDAVIQFRETSDLFGMDIAYIGNLDNRIYIRGYNNSATAVNHIAINRNDGYVGIGTTSPATPLHIYNATNAILRLQTIGTDDASIELIRGTTTDTSTDWKITNEASTGGLHILSSVSGTSTDRFVITNGGKVGIGTTDPQYNLDIEGTFPVIKLLAPTAGSSFVKFFEGNELFGYDIGYNGSANRFMFRSFDNSATPVEHLSISRGSGRFGIGGVPVTTTRMKVYGILADTAIAEFSSSTGAQGINITNTAIATAGTDANISLNLQAKGTGGIFLQAPSGTTRITINGSTGAVSIPGTLSAGATTITGNSSVSGTMSIGSATAQLLIGGNSITAQGSDANIPISITTKGTSAFSIRTGTTPTTRLSITDVGLVTIGGGLNTGSITSTGAITATTNISCGTVASFIRISAGSLTVTGNDVSIPLSISAKGVGALTLSTNTVTRLTIAGDTGLATFANNVSITGTNTTTGTSTLTGRVGIGKAPHATYACDINGTLNATNVLVNGSGITGSKWTTGTPSTNIYYSAGNVAIGTTDTSTYRLNVLGNTYISGQLTTGGGIDVGSIVATSISAASQIQSSSYVYGATAIYSAGFVQGGGSANNWRLTANDSWIRLRDPGETTHRDFAAGQLYAHNNLTGPSFLSTSSGCTVSGLLYVTDQLNAYFIAVNRTNTDYLCVQQNYANEGTGAANTIKVAHGSFTAFHRCYTDDELYNNETDEIIDIFKNKYVGRVVIATGKIKTDFSREKESEPNEDEWYSGIDKDGISIEDAIPIVALSRKKKDKRVFGVFGAPNRSTNNKNRLIVNSVGEGGICVSNTNGNIENGDYIQSSDLLGYGEKQDDDLLHNYTIAKATIDCNFDLDSPYYRCEEIENGVRVAFIACSYHSG